MAGWLIGIGASGFFVSLGLCWAMQPKRLRKDFGAAGCRRWWAGSFFIALAGTVMAVLAAWAAWYPGALLGVIMGHPKTLSAILFSCMCGLGAAACSTAFIGVLEESLTRRKEGSPPAPADTRQPVGRSKVTPDEIRARGWSWPLPGYGEDSFQRDEHDRLDLDEAIQSTAESMEFWSGIYDGATGMVSAASTVSIADSEDFKEGRREAAAKVQHYRSTLSRLKAIRAEFKPTSGRN